MNLNASRLSRPAVILAVLCMSTSAIFIRLATAPSVVLALYRMAISALLMLPVVLMRRDNVRLAELSASERICCPLAGVAFGMHFLCYFAAVNHTAIATAVMLSCTEVFYVAIFAFVFFHERISPKGWIGIGVTFAGCVLLALAQGMQGGDAQGILYGVAASVFAGAFTLLGRRCRAKISNSQFTFVVFIAGSVMLLTGCLLGGFRLTGYGLINVFCALGMAVCCTLLGHSLLTWALRYQPASFISSMKMTSPVLSALLGWVLMGEAPKPTVLAACAVIIGGILYYYRQE